MQAICVPPSRTVAATWFRDQRAYARGALPAAERGTVPLIEPSDALRRMMWNEVLLRWSPLAASAPRFPRWSGEALIDVGEAFAGLSAVLAPLLGMDLIKVASWGEIPQRARHHRAMAVLAEPEQCTLRRLHALQRTVRGAWTVLTGLDAAAVAFVVAKGLLYCSDSFRRTVVIDALDEACDVADALAEANDLAILVAHGEAGHCNLHSIVLCGAVGVSETVRNGGRPGCFESDGVRACKRCRSEDVRIIRFAELMARRVMLYSCSAFDVAGQQYPSDASAVLALLDGHAVEVAAMDRAAEVHPHAPATAAAIYEAGHEPAALAALENDYLERVSGCTPFLSAGLRRPRCAVRRLHSSRVVRAQQAVGGGVRRSPGGAATVMAGLRWLRVPAQAAVAPLTTLRVEWIDEQKRLWGEYRLAALRAMRVGACIRDARLSESAEYGAQELSAAAAALAQLALGARIELHEAVRRGALDEQFEATSGAAALIEMETSRRLFELLSGPLLQSNSFIDILTGGTACAEDSAAGRCERCDCEQRRRRLVDLEHDVLAFDVTECPACGPKTLCVAGTDSLRVTAPALARAGAEYRITVERPCAGRGGSPETGHIAVDVKDNGRGVVVYQARSVLALPAGYVAEFVLPGESSADLSTVRVLVVGGGLLTYERRRVPVVRP